MDYEMTYEEVLSEIIREYPSDTIGWSRFTGDDAFQRAEILESVGIKQVTAADGSVRYYTRAVPITSTNSGVTSTNSNYHSASYGGNARSYNINGTATQTTVEGKKVTTFENGAKTVSTGSKVMTMVSEASWLTMAASMGGRLGIMLSQEFYDSGYSWAWSKEDWADFITNDADDLDRAVLSFLTGIDANGNTTEYMDEQALAQMYMMLRDMGVFDNAYEVEPVTVTVDDYITSSDIVYGDYTSVALAAGLTPTEIAWLYAHQASSTGTYGVLYRGNGTNYVLGTNNVDAILNINSRVTNVGDNSCSITPSIRQGFNWYAWTHGDGTTPTSAGIVNPVTVTSLVNYDSTLGASFVLGSLKAKPNIDGLDKDPEATTYIDPSLVNGQDRDTVLQQLQQNYPELFDGAIYQDVPQKDGTNKRIRSVPVPYVKPSAQPVTGSNHQNNPSANPQTNTPTELEDIVKMITQLLTPTDVPDTGDGDTPVVPAPTGSASSLWAVYNPTQAQVDSFGGWLWSSNFVDQLKKLFADPMQAIIGIHKVFATPTTGATQTIVCGYLDSEVPSKIVTSQYTTVDCGNVNLREYFGNVFDYSPYTEVSLYLPFIGIVRLDVSDVMRASIKVKYHVDVITGACLADVVVDRDGAGGVLYQYAGSAIVTYPISSGSYASAVGGILSIAGGVAATVLTGGAAAPAVLGAAAGISHLHTDVQKSGSFSGAAGAMGSKKPYIIISRPQTGMPSSFKHLQGYPVNYYTKLGDCSGHVRVSDVQVKGMNATDTELDMIRDALLQGVEL